MVSADQPAPPDPQATIAAQSASNKATAVAQTGLNSIDQYTPDGSLTYNEHGTWSDGTPRFSATTSLSAPAQRIFDTNNVTKQNIATIGADQSARIGGILSDPLKLGNEATEKRLFELGSARLDPRFAQSEEALRTRLANSGIKAGSAAYDAEMRDFNAGKNDAFNSLLLSGRGMANQELLTERQTPINEISALMSGSQVAQPNFVSTPQTQVAGTDVAGITQSGFNNQLANASAENSMNQALMGGLFGLAGAGVGAYGRMNTPVGARR